MSAKSAGSVGVEIVALNAQKAISEMKAYISSLTSMETATKKAADTINQSFAKLGSGGGLTGVTTGLKQVDTQVKSTTTAVTGSATQMGTAFVKVGTEIGKSVTSATTNFNKLNTTTKQVAAGTTQVSTAFAKVGTDINKSVTTASTSFTKLNTTTKQVAEGTKLVSQAFVKVGTDIDSSAKKSDTSLTKLNTTTKTLAQGTTQVSQAFNKVGTDISTSSQKATTAVTQLSTKYKETVTSVEKLGNVTKTTTTNLDAQGRSIGTTVQQVTKLKDSTVTLNTTLDAQGRVLERNKQTLMNSNNALEQTTSKTARLGQASQTLFLGVSTLTSGVFNLYNQYDSLNDATMQVERRLIRAKNSQDQATKAQKAHAEAVKEGGHSLEEINLLLDDYQDKQRAANVAQEIAADVQDDLARSWKDFYINALPAGIQTMAGAVVTLKEVGGAMSGLAAKGKFAGITSAMAGIAGAVGLGIGAFVALVASVAVAAAALAAYGTNFMGFRDIVNDTGKSIGDMNPILKIVGDGLVGLAGTLGLTGESAEQTKGHFIDMAMGIKQQSDVVSTAWHDSLVLMQQSNNVFAQDVANTVINVTTSYQKMNDDFKTQIDLSIGTWNEFIHALSQGDFEGAVNIMIQAFEDIPGILDTVFKDVSAFATDIYNGITGTFTDILPVLTKWGSDAGAAILGGLEAAVGLIDAVIGRIVPGWGDIKEQVGTWVTTNIVTPLTAWYEQIKVPAGDLWNQIVGTATSIVDTVNTWVTTNIVEPLTAWWESVLIEPETLWTSIAGAPAALKATVDAWITTNIVEPIQAFPNTLALGAEKIWLGIVGAATTMKTTVDTWITDNITEPILAIPNNILVGAEKLWLGIVGTAVDITTTIDTWLTKNIVDPIKNLPNLIVSQGLEIIKAVLGFNSPLEGATVAKLGEWNKAVATEFTKIPTLVVDQAAKILDGILKGDVGTTISKWVGGVWAAIKSEFDKLIAGAQAALANIQSAIGGASNDLQSRFEGVLPPQLAAKEREAPKQPDIGDPTKSLAQQLWEQSQGGGTKQQGTTAQPGFHTVAAGGGGGKGGPSTTSNSIQATRKAQGLRYRDDQGNWHEATQQGSVPQEQTLAPSIKTTAKPPTSTWDRAPTEAEKASLTSRAPPTGVAGAFALPPPEEIVKSTEAYTKLKDAVTAASNANSQYGMILNTQAGQEQLVRQGQENRVKTMQDLEAANITAIGSNKEYAAQIESQNLLGVAYEAGLRKQETALMDQQVALATAQGATAKLNEQMATGLPQAIAFAEGVNKQEMALNNMKLATVGTQGELSKLGAQLDAGTIQAAAFESGYTNAAMSAAKMQVDVASLAGEVQYLGESLSKSEDILARQNMAFLEGQKGAIEWGMGLQTATQSQEGFRTGINQVAQALGVELPEGFRGSNEAMQEWIELSQGAGAAFDSFIQSIQAGGASIVSGLGDAIKQGNKELNDAIDTMEEEAGFNFSSSLENAFESQAGIDAIAKTATDMMHHMEALGSDITPEHFNELRAGFSGSIMETLGDVSDELGAEGATMVQKLLDAINQPVDLTSPTGLTDYFANIKQVMIEMAGQGSATAQQWVADMGTINGIKFDEAKKSFVDLNGNLVSFEEAARIAGQSTSGLATGTTAAGTAAGTATPQMQAFYDTVANFGTLESLMITIFTQKFPQHVKAGIDASTQHFADFNNTIAPTFGEFESLITTMFETNMPTHAETGIAKVVTAFEGMKTSIESVLSSIDLSALGGGGEAGGGGGDEPGGQAGGGAGAPATGDTGGAGGGGEEATGFLAKLTEQMAQVPVIITTAFTQGVQNAMGQYNLLNEYTIVLVANINMNLQLLIEYFTTTFSQATQNAMGSYNLLNEYTLTMVENINMNLQLLVEYFTTTFNLAVSNAMGTYNLLNEYTATLIENINSQIQVVVEHFTTHFSQAVQNAMGQYNILNAYTKTLVSNIDAEIKKVVTSFTQAFTTAVNSAKANLSSLGTVAHKVFADIVLSVNGAKNALTGLITQANSARSAMEGIRSSASSAMDMVRQLASSLNSLQNISRTITYTYRTVGSPPAGAQQGMILPRFGMGGNDRDLPFDVRPDKVLVGENGRELVVLADQGGNTRSFVASHMQDVNIKDKDLTVIPLERRNSENFLDKFPMYRPIANMLQDKLRIPRLAFGVSPGADPNTASGPIRESTDGKIHTWEDGDRAFTVDEWNDLSDQERTNRSESDDEGIKSLPNGSFLEEDYSVSDKGGTYGSYINNTTWRTGPNAGERSSAYDEMNGPGTGGGGTGGTGGGDWGDIQTSGTGTRWEGANQDARTWQVVSMIDNPNLFKVVDANGKNIATNFTSRAQATAYIQEKQAQQAGTGTPGTGVPPGTPTGGGGTNQGTTYAVPNYVQDVTQHTAERQAQGLPVHANWSNPDTNPDNWRVAQMEEDTNGRPNWKVTDAQGKTIAIRFESVAEAEAYIAHHKYAKQRNAYNNDPLGGGEYRYIGPSGGTGGVPPGTPTGYTQPDYVQTSGGTKWSTAPGEPTSWQIVPMTDAAHQGEFKVVDSTGKNVAANFKSQEEANQWVAWKKAGSPTGGTGGTGGTPGTPAIPPSTYTPHADVVAHDPNPSGDPAWQGPIDTSDPSTWKVVRMSEPNPATGEYRWKVQNKDNKNIALRFNTQADAQAYIDAHKLAKQRGGYTSPTEGGGVLEIPGVAAVPGTPGTGGGGGGTGGTPGTPAIPPSTYTPPTYVQDVTQHTAERQAQGLSIHANWTNPDMNPDHWVVAQMSEDTNGRPNWKVTDAQGKTIAIRFESVAEAQEYIDAHKLAKQRGGYTTNDPTGGGQILEIPGVAAVPGTPGTGGGGGGTGGQIPGHTGNYNYQINGRQLQITNGVITKNTLVAADWDAADADFFAKTGKHLPPFGAGTPTQPGAGGAPGDTEGSLPGWGGETYIPGMGGTPQGTGAGGGTGGSSSVTSQGFGAGNFAPYTLSESGLPIPLTGGGGIPGTPGTGGGGGGGGGGGFGGINFPPGFPFHNRPEVIGGGGPNIGGIQFPKGFPFNNISSLTGTGTGTQTATQSGTGKSWYYQSQNGKINTNMTPDMLAKWGLPGLGLGGGGGGGSGTITDPTNPLFGKDAGLRALMSKMIEIPKITSNNYDSMGIPMGNEQDPLYREFGFNRILTGGVGGNNPNIPGGPGGGLGQAFDWIKKLLSQLNTFTQALLSKTLNDKSIWQSLSHITTFNMGTLP